MQKIVALVALACTLAGCSGGKHPKELAGVWKDENRTISLYASGDFVDQYYFSSMAGEWSARREGGEILLSLGAFPARARNVSDKSFELLVGMPGVELSTFDKPEGSPVFNMKKVRDLPAAPVCKASQIEVKKIDVVVGPFSTKGSYELVNHCEQEAVIFYNANVFIGDGQFAEGEEGRVGSPEKPVPPGGSMPVVVNTSRGSNSDFREIVLKPKFVVTAKD